MTSTLTLWAPRATTVDLLLYSDETTVHDTLPMQRQADGMWAAPHPIDDDTLYMFSVDGSQPYPDPRAARLPYSVHGPAATWNPNAYKFSSNWQGKETLGSVFYECHIGTFTTEGTFEAAAAKFDYLKDIGVDTIELMPVVPSPGKRGWGYDGVSLYAVWEQYGGPTGLQRFVDRAHQKGLAVCIDVVLNHAGPEGNYIQNFGPYFAPKHKTPWGDGFNTDSDECAYVRDYLMGIPLRLFETFQVDAIRLDAVHALADDSPTHILAELSQKTDELSAKLHRPLRLIAESDLNDPTMVTPRDQGGYGIHGQWDDDVHHAVHVAFTGEDHGYFHDFADPDAMRKTYEDVFYHNGTFSTFRNKYWGSPVPDSMNRTKFVVFSNNHDQVGNRALGDRPCHTMTMNTYAAQAAFIILSPYTPMLFMGEEWAASTPFQFFTDYNDPGLDKAVSEGRKNEFAGHGWEKLYGSSDLDIPDPQALSTYTNSILNWDEVGKEPHKEILSWYKKLIKLRKECPDVTSGKKPRFIRENDLFALIHTNTIVMANLGEEKLTFPVEKLCINNETTEHNYRVALTWKNDATTTFTGDSVSLQPHSTLILARK